MRQNIIILLFILPFLFGSATYAQDSQEKIQSFSSTIIVNTDASIDVTENITVVSNQQKIVHGIVRWLPTRYTDSYGISHRTNYLIQNIFINNMPSPYHEGYSSDQIAIYIGDKNTVLTPGIYQYTIRYHVKNAVNFLSDGDEIYWNITGNNWDFVIEQAEATIILPNSAQISRYTAYTGITGAKDQNYTASKTAANTITFNISKPLQPGEGLTVAASWQKGVVQQPAWQDRLLDELLNGPILPMGLTILTLLYYLYIWNTVGRDPEKGTIVPLFEPPEKLTPEAMRFIMRMGFDNKAYSAAIVNLAAKGYLKINNQGNEFELVKDEKYNETLPDEERLLGNELFKPRNAFLKRLLGNKLVESLLNSNNTLSISRTNKTILRNAHSTLEKTLTANYQNKYFVTNRKYLSIGWCLTFITLILIILSSVNPVIAAFMIVWLSGWTVGCLVLISVIINMYQSAWITRSISTAFGCLFLTAFSIPFLFGEVAGIVMATTAMGVHNLSIFITAIILNIVFWILMKSPTAEGRRLMDKIEGFKLFFRTTEHYRMQQLSNPQKTVELYEKYLPYAIALDMESEWSTQFNTILQQAGTEPSTYHPSWYSGHTSSWSSQGMASLPILLGAGLASSLASASTSSSASGGGGSSGGGGGGGGGGGW